MTNIVSSSTKQLAQAISKFTTYTILVWPIRMLVIVSALIIPVLLGLIIWFYYQHQNQIDKVLDQAKTIEGMIINNVEKGIDFIKEEIGGDVTPENVNKFVEEKLLKPLKVVLVNYYNQANKEVKSIKIDATDLDDLKITYDGGSINIKNMETLIKTEIKYVLNDVIPQIIDLLQDTIGDQIGEGDTKAIQSKKDEMKNLFTSFSNDSNNTFAYIITQWKLFYD